MDGGTVGISGATSANPYPGSETTPEDTLRLAEGYREAALEIFAFRKAKARRMRPAGRFNAVHAIELYLNAFLSLQGEVHGALRSHQHLLGERSQLARAHGLRLRPKTEKHLAQLDAEREYLVVRYAPERMGTLSQVNRLTATLEEMAREVHTAFFESQSHE